MILDQNMSQGFASVSDIEAYFFNEIFESKSKLDHIVKRRLEDEEEDVDDDDLRRNEDIDHEICMTYLVQYEGESACIRSLRIEIGDLGTVATPEIGKFNQLGGRENEERGDFCSQDDVDRYYEKKMDKYEFEREWLENIEEEKWGEGVFVRWKALVLGMRDLEAKKGRELELGERKGWMFEVREEN